MSENLLMDDDNKSNLKKPLIYGAIAFLIFIVVVIVIAISQNSKNENEIVPVDNKPQEIAPKIQTQESNFQPLAVEEETPKINKDKLINEKEPIVNEEKELEKPRKIEEKNLKKQPQQVAFRENENIKETKPLTVKHKQTKNTTKKISGNYYIQVAALLKHAKPNKKFLELIKKNGFNYRFYTTYINKNGEKIKVTKVLIGPFKTKKEAKKALVKVKQTITQNAFVFKVK